MEISGSGYQGYVWSEGEWSPSNQVIAALESAVPDSLARAIADRTLKTDQNEVDLPPRLAGFTRRYRGTVQYDHDRMLVNGTHPTMRVVAVEFFCRAHEAMARSDPSTDAAAKVGGDCSVHALYSPERKQFLRWWVNGSTD